MIGPVPGVSSAVTPEARLREAARALEGVFIAQLYQAMRKTVPDGGVMEDGPGHAIFTEMFDERIAETLAQRLEGSLGDRLYEQLRAALGPTDHA